MNIVTKIINVILYGIVAFVGGFVVACGLQGILGNEDDRHVKAMLALWGYDKKINIVSDDKKTDNE